MSPLADDVVKTQSIASLRVHVERAINKIKNFHIWDGIVPLNLFGVVNQMWTVCAVLCNLQSTLLVCNFSPFQHPKLHEVLNFHLNFLNLILSFQFRDVFFLLGSPVIFNFVIDFDHQLPGLKLFAGKFATTSLQTAGYVLVIGKRVLVYILEQCSDIQALDNDINVHNLCTHLLLY